MLSRALGFHEAPGLLGEEGFIVVETEAVHAGDGADEQDDRKQQPDAHDQARSWHSIFFRRRQASTPPEQGDEMETAVEEEAEGRGVEFQIDLKGRHFQVQFFPDPAPGRLLPVVMGQVDSMTRVADAIHEAQGWARQPTREQMILDEEMLSAHSRGFGEQVLGVPAVMEGIDEEGAIEAGIGGGNRLPVEEFDGDARARADRDIHPPQFQIRPPGSQMPGEQAIPTAHIQQAGLGGNQFIEMFAEDFDPP